MKPYSIIWKSDQPALWGVAVDFPEFLILMSGTLGWLQMVLPKHWWFMNLCDECNWYVGCWLKILRGRMQFLSCSLQFVRQSDYSGLDQLWFASPKAALVLAKRNMLLTECWRCVYIYILDVQSIMKHLLGISLPVMVQGPALREQSLPSQGDEISVICLKLGGLGSSSSPKEFWWFRFSSESVGIRSRQPTARWFAAWNLLEVQLSFTGEESLVGNEAQRAPWSLETCQQ